MAVLSACFSFQTCLFNNIVYIPLENYAVPSLFYGSEYLTATRTEMQNGKHAMRLEGTEVGCHLTLLVFLCTMQT
jgi:hypothetical protein